MKRITIALALIATLSACGHTPIVSTPPAGCSKLIPSDWSKGVDAAPIPENAPGIADWIGKPLTAAVAAAIAAPWAAGYVAMSGQLDKANDRTAATVSIVTNCEAMVNAARPVGG